MWCPRCQAEHRPGLRRCPDCGATMLLRPPVRPVKEDLTAILLISASTEVEVGTIQELLRSAGIPFYTQDRETGLFLRVCTGLSMFGRDIFVRAEDYLQARELLETYLSGGAGVDEAALTAAALGAEPEQEPPDYDGEDEDNPLKILGAILILLAAMVIVMALVRFL